MYLGIDSFYLIVILIIYILDYLLIQIFRKPNMSLKHSCFILFLLFFI